MVEKRHQTMSGAIARGTLINAITLSTAASGVAEITAISIQCWRKMRDVVVTQAYVTRPCPRLTTSSIASAADFTSKLSKNEPLTAICEVIMTWLQFHALDIGLNRERLSVAFQ